MAHTTTDAAAVMPMRRNAWASSLRLLARDRWALASVIFLLLIVTCALLGDWMVGNAATAINLRGRNLPPFVLERGWLMILGSDSLGRSIVARLVIGSFNTLSIAGSAVLLSLLVGSALGLIAGYRGGWVSNLIMQAADILMSFPSLLLALVILYILEPRVGNLVIVLAISRVPIYLRTARAETLEVRERMFVTAARVMGAGSGRLVWRHIVPMVTPTMITLATLEFASVMLSESSLSFLGLGVQPPGITWGLMVAEGRAYLGTAWWLSFWPGLAITLTAISVNLLSNWVRVVADPQQRWRLEARSRANG